MMTTDTKGHAMAQHRFTITVDDGNQDIGRQELAQLTEAVFKAGISEAEHSLEICGDEVAPDAHRAVGLSIMIES
jgi:hypothetical protein